MTPNELRRFDKKWMPEPMTGCWLWLRAARNGGYGHMWIGDKCRAAHQLAYEHYVGPIPAGKEVCHRCDTPACCNPDHLFIDDHAGNVRDMFAKGRNRNQFTGKTSCGNGHEYTESNTYIDPDGRRRCRTCLLGQSRRHNERRKSQRRTNVTGVTDDRA